MFVTFDRHTDTPGRISNIMSGPDPETYGPALEAHGYEWFYCIDDKNFPAIHGDYVDLSLVPEGEKPSQKHIRPRPQMTLVDDGKMISGFPQGSKVQIDYATTVVVEGVQVDDGTLEFDAPAAGTYVIHADCWPYFRTTLQVTR